MSRTLILKKDLYDQLVRGAATRGLTVETFLERVVQAVGSSVSQTAQDRTRSRRIERLLAKYQEGPLSDHERTELDRLIDEDYQAAVKRADRRIDTKLRETSRGRSNSSGRQTARSPASAPRGRRT